MLICWKTLDSQQAVGVCAELHPIKQITPDNFTELQLYGEEWNLLKVRLTMIEWASEHALIFHCSHTQVVLPKNTPPPCWLSEHFHHNEKWKMFWFFQVINSLKYLRSRHISHSSKNLLCLYFLTLFIFSSLSSLCFRGNSICLTAKQFRIFVTSVNISQHCV